MVTTNNENIQDLDILSESDSEDILNLIPSEDETLDKTIESTNSFNNQSDDHTGGKHHIENSLNYPKYRHSREADSCFKCRICGRKIKSLIAFTKHIRKHTAKCPKCKQKFESWKQLENHLEYCPRRFGVENRMPVRQPKNLRPKLPFKCCLCNRRYENYKNLFDHQVKRCKKRYVRAQWVVKI